MQYDPTVNNMLRVYIDDKPTNYGAYSYWYYERGYENRLHDLYEHLVNEHGSCGWPQVQGTIVRYYRNAPGVT
jgi:hypothetical protein